jgi:cytochrome P450
MAEATDQILFNPMDPAFRANPYPAYRRLRETSPMWLSPFGFWVATRHADIVAILRDRRMGQDFEGRIRRGPEPWRLDEPAVRNLGQTMLMRDPPDHTRLRGLVAKAFTAKRMEEMRPRIRAIVHALIDAVEGRGEMDVVRDVAHKLPVIVICDMLGIPEEDRAQFLERSRVSGRLVDPTPMSREELDNANAGNAELETYFKALFARRRREPGDDLTTALVQARDEDGVLTDQELTWNTSLLFAAGHETTANLIGNGLLTLHRHPDQLARLKAEPELMPNAIEEMLRYESSVQLTGRTAFEDIEVGGVTIRREESVICLLAAANRDPEVFAEPDPETFDVARPGVRALSFGGGIHHCLGAQLARIEGEEAFSALLDRLPNLRLENVDNPSWRPTFTLRGLTTLKARW